LPAQPVGEIFGHHSRVTRERRQLDCQHENQRLADSDTIVGVDMLLLLHFVVIAVCMNSDCSSAIDEFHLVAAHFRRGPESRFCR
jgi:hypothetical protein